MITSHVFADAAYKSTKVWKEENDCSVIAMSIVLDIPYAKAWYACRKHGRKFKKGMDMDDYLDALRSLGAVTTDIIFDGSSMEFMRKYSKGSYIIQTRNHVIAMRDGVIHDETQNWNMESIRMLKVFPKWLNV